ncbi:hypothetical protein C0J52_14556 [Blattella germanica]|nr:hypothetical protein C0J52_14556 [Blattella germanica]
MSKKSPRKKSVDKTEKNGVEENANVQECIKTLRELVKEEKNLNVRTDDVFLLRFLRWVDFDTELAFTKMKHVYKFRTDNRDWFTKKRPSELENCLSRNIQIVLHDRDDAGRRVYIVKLGQIDTRYVSMFEYTHTDDLFMETIVMEEETQKNGIAVIMDMAGYSWKLFSWLTPHNNRMGSAKLDCLSIRNLEVHVVNTSFLLNASIAIVYPFLDAKIKERNCFLLDIQMPRHDVEELNNTKFCEKTVKR